MKGLYPNYTTHLEDDKKSFILDLNFNATSLPHWVAQEASNGYFPWLLGWARYGFIPTLDASGNITIEGVKSHATGVGYHEHVWGNFTYGFSKITSSNLKEFIKNLNKTLPFVRWSLSERSTNFLKTSMFTTDNFFGYEWGWAPFDNGWSVQFGIFHTLDFITEGSVCGELSLTPDGKTYWDFADIKMKYGRTLYLEEADVYYPLDIEITARNGDKTLHLRFNTTAGPYLGLVGVFPSSRFFCGQGGIQTVGVAEGYYQDSEQSVPLHGICSITPCKQYLTTKHNSLRIEFLRPPQGRGFSIEIISHRLGFEMLFERQFSPYLERHFSIKRYHYIPVAEPEPPPEYPNASCVYVGGCGANNYTRIQDAIENVSDGDTVFVYNGTYAENVVINKTIRLIGENKNKVSIEPGDLDGIRITANNVEIAGFTIRSEKADGYDDSAIDLSSSGNYVHDNIITQSEWYGIFISNASYNIIEHNSIIDNDISIWLYRSNDNIIRYNNITLSKWVGIWSWPYSRNNVISCNNFIGNKIHSQNSDVKYRNSWEKNYWDDYTGLKFKRLADLNNDGIGNIPYQISRHESDQYPMMSQYNYN